MPHYPTVYLYTLLSVSEAFLAGLAEWLLPGKECPFWSSVEGTAPGPWTICSVPPRALYWWLRKELTRYDELNVSRARREVFDRTTKCAMRRSNK